MCATMNQASFKYYIWILESNGTYFIPYICQNQYSNLGYSAGTLLGSSSRGGAVTGILVGTLPLPIKASHCAISGHHDYSLSCILAAQIWTTMHWLAKDKEKGAYSSEGF